MNPRLVWLVGAIKEQFPDVPEQTGNELVLWDRKHKKAVMTVAPEYAQAMCLETVPAGAPFTAMEDWFNGLDEVALASEGLPV